MTLRESSSTGSLASLARERVQQQRRSTAGRLSAGRKHTTASCDVAERTAHCSARLERQLDPHSSQSHVDLGVGRDPMQQLMFEKALLSSRYVNFSSLPPFGVAGTSGLLDGTVRARKTIPTVRSTGNLNFANSRSSHSSTSQRHGHGLHIPQSARPSNAASTLEAAAAATAAPLTSALSGQPETPIDLEPTSGKVSVRICEADCDGNVSTSVPSASTPLPPPSGERILGEALESAGIMQARGPTRKPYGSRLENKPLGFPLPRRSCSLAEKQRVMGTSPENGMANPRFVWGDWDGPTPERQLRQARPPPSAASPLSSENLQAHEMQQHHGVQRRTSRERTGSSQMHRATSARSLHSERNSCSSQKQQSTAGATSLSRSLSQSKPLGKEARSASQPALQRPTWSEIVAEGEKVGATLRARTSQQIGKQPHDPDVENSLC